MHFVPHGENLERGCPILPLKSSHATRLRRRQPRQSGRDARRRARRQSAACTASRLHCRFPRAQRRAVHHRRPRRQLSCAARRGQRARAAPAPLAHLRLSVDYRVGDHDVLYGPHAARAWPHRLVRVLRRRRLRERSAALSQPRRHGVACRARRKRRADFRYAAALRVAPREVDRRHLPRDRRFALQPGALPRRGARGLRQRGRLHHAARARSEERPAAQVHLRVLAALRCLFASPWLRQRRGGGAVRHHRCRLRQAAAAPRRHREHRDRHRRSRLHRCGAGGLARAARRASTVPAFSALRRAAHRVLPRACARGVCQARAGLARGSRGRDAERAAGGGGLARTGRAASAFAGAHRRRRADDARPLHGQGLDARRAAVAAHRQPRRHARRRDVGSPHRGGRMKAKVNDTELYYELHGKEGAPWLIFSHSLACTVRMWDPQIAAFKDRYRILAYDMRGHGQSAAPTGPYTLEMLADDVLALMKELHIPRARYVGLSIGGMIGQHLALKDPGRFERMVLADTGHTQTPETLKPWEERIRIAQAQGMKPLVAGTMERWFTPSFRETPQAKKIAELIANTPVAGYVGCGQAIMKLNTTARLKEIKLAVLAITGEADAAAAGTRYLGEHIPGAKFVNIAQAAHIANLEQAEKFNQALRDFL